MIKLIAGLGNPGAEYSATRHNAGFWAVDAIARATQTTLRHEARFHGLAARARFHGSEVWLLQPETFVNRSGQSVAALARFHKILPAEILVLHDELDLPPGAAKLKFSGGSGGHNGLKDIAAHLATPQYWRLRLGIGHPRDSAIDEKKSAVVNYVLKPPRKEEQALVNDAIRRSLAVMQWVVQGEMERAMMQLHGQSRLISG